MDDDLDDELADVLRPGRRVSEAELAEMERDRQAHERPNEPDADPFDACAGSKYATHSFAIADPLGHKCRFCGRRWRDCLRGQE